MPDTQHSPDECSQLDPPVDRPLVRYPVKAARVLIDAEDLPKVQAHTWMIDKDGYARARGVGFIHRYLMNATDPSLHVDHRNRNRLDCRKCNLRVISGSLNNLNTTKAATGGVRKTQAGYVARVTYRGEYIHIGTFADEQLAKKARDAAVASIMAGEPTITIYRAGSVISKDISHE